MCEPSTSCVGHDDDAVIPQLREIEVLAPDSAAERGNHRADFVAAQHLVEARLSRRSESCP
jgi:hypothetical protein